MWAPTKHKYWPKYEGFFLKIAIYGLCAECQVKKEPIVAYCGHNGVPCGCEDVTVVVALIMTLQLLGEVLSGELNQQTERAKINQQVLKVHQAKIHLLLSP